jgi:hypothetical protein
LSGATIPAISSLFAYLCERNAVSLNPVAGVKRPRGNSNEGKTPAIGDHEARALLDSPDPETLKGKRDRAMLSVLPGIQIPGCVVPHSSCPITKRTWASLLASTSAQVRKEVVDVAALPSFIISSNE